MTLRSIIGADGNPWFVAADVCRCIGVHLDWKGSPNVTRACAKLDRSEVTLHPVKGSASQRVRDTNIISESGLYKLIMRSDKKEARVFQDWVTKDVTIRLKRGRIIGKNECAETRPFRNVKSKQPN